MTRFGFGHERFIKNYGGWKNKLLRI